METHKIISLLNDSTNEESKFAIKFDKENIKSSLFDYSDAFVLVAGNITVTANNNTDVAFKICAPFSICETEINDIFIDEANHIYIARYNWIEYWDNYWRLWQLKKDDVPANKA